MFSTKTAVFDSSNKYMNAGINDNVTLKEVNVLKSPNGRDYLEIIFEDANGAIASLTEWKNEKNMWIKTDEELQRRDNQQFGRMLQILKCYFETIEDVELNTFVDMITWIKSKLDTVISGKKLLRLKTTYDNKGFIRVSTYGIFVEPMDVEETQIVLTGRDKTTRPEIKVDDEKSTDPLGNATPDNTIAEDKKDDLPF
jgi:hypothetical protein